jgi:hypothetical protein
MTKLQGQQLSLIAESEFSDPPVGDWDYDELGTDQILVPNFPDQKLGTNKILVPNFPDRELGTNKILVPNSDDRELGTNEWTPPDWTDWKPPIGCFQQKWIKNHQYWYWRYYNNEGKKASLYLHKDYNKAVRKAIKIGCPVDAKPAKLPTQQADSQERGKSPSNLIDIAQTAHSTPRNTRAA